MRKREITTDFSKSRELHRGGGVGEPRALCKSLEWLWGGEVGWAPCASQAWPGMDGAGGPPQALCEPCQLAVGLNFMFSPPTWSNCMMESCPPHETKQEFKTSPYSLTQIHNISNNNQNLNTSSQPMKTNIETSCNARCLTKDTFGACARN